MADENILPRDQNHITAAGFESDSTPGLVLPGKIDEITGRILVDSSGGGMGTVTSFSFNDANGFDGTVTNPTTTPQLTLTTTITNGALIKSNSGALAAAVANTDYQVPIILTTTGSSGVATFNGTTLNIPNYSGGGGTVVSVIGTANRITVDSTDPANPIVNIAATYVGQSSITTLGTITTGVWNGTVVTGQYGGTGVANTGKTITVSGNTTIGSNTDTVAFVTAGNTSVTLPTSGTLMVNPMTTGGDLIYGGASGAPTRLANGSATNVLTSAGGTSAPTWSAIPVQSTITVANEATDTSCFVAFFTDATGNLQPKTNTNMTFNSNTGVVTFASSVLTTTDINGGTIDGTVIGGSSAAAGTFTTLGGTVISASTSVVLDNGDTGSGVTLVSASAPGSVTATFPMATGTVVIDTATQTLTNKTLTAPVIGGAAQLAEGASIRLDQTLSADGTYSGLTIAGTAGATLAFGDLIYLAVADSRWELTDADSVTTAGAVLTGMCVLAAAADGDPTVILLQGNVRADANFPALTVGAPVYTSTTPGDIQVAQPSGTDDVIQVVGFALTADSIYFNPSQDYITHT